MPDLRTVSASFFMPFLRQSFVIETDSGTAHACTLIDVRERPTQGSGSGAPVRPPFSIVFRTDGTVRLPQNTYTVRHASIEPMDLFIVPIGSDDEGAYYQAIFG